jgi:predicted nucleic-acid-binding protein
MIGLDTNVLVRYLIQDDPEQADRATRLIEGQCTAKTPGRITQIVLCELVWVLIRAYGYSKMQVIAVLDQLLVTAEFEVEQEALSRRALDAYRDGKADFSDYIVALNNQAAGCETTFTFDTRLGTHAAARAPD